MIGSRLERMLGGDGCFVYFRERFSWRSVIELLVVVVGRTIMDMVPTSKGNSGGYVHSL